MTYSIHGMDYAAAFDRFSVPIHLQIPIMAWLELGELPSGAFLRCVIRNDLAGLFMLADRSDQAAVRSVVRFMAEHALEEAWGLGAMANWPDDVKAIRSKV